MAGNLSNRTDEMQQHLALSETSDEVTIGIDIDLNEINFRVAFQSLPFDALIEFTDLPLETDDKAAKLVIECKKQTWRNKNLSSTFQSYFNITSMLFKELSTPSNQLLSTTHVNEQEEEGQQLNNSLKDFIEEYKSLEKQLLTHNAKINPKRRMYVILKVVAMTLTMVPFLGPVTLTSIIGGRPHPAQAAALVTSAFVACGAIGRAGALFFNKEMKALKVQKEIIGLMLMSIAFQKKDLNCISHYLKNGLFRQGNDVCNTICELQKRLKNERKIILQKLSESESFAEDNTFGRV